MENPSGVTRVTERTLTARRGRPEPPRPAPRLRPENRAEYNGWHRAAKERLPQDGPRRIRRRPVGSAGPRARGARRRAGRAAPGAGRRRGGAVPGREPRARPRLPRPRLVARRARRLLFRPHRGHPEQPPQSEPRRLRGHRRGHREGRRPEDREALLRPDPVRHPPRRHGRGRDRPEAVGGPGPGLLRPRPGRPVLSQHRRPGPGQADLPGPRQSRDPEFPVPSPGPLQGPLRLPPRHRQFQEVLRLGRVDRRPSHPLSRPVRPRGGDVPRRARQALGPGRPRRPGGELSSRRRRPLPSQALRPPVPRRGGIRARPRPAGREAGASSSGTPATAPFPS